MQGFQEKHRSDVPAKNVKKEVEAAKTAGAFAQGKGSEDLYPMAPQNLTAQAEETVTFLGNLPKRIIPAYASTMATATTSTQTTTNDKNVPMPAKKKLIEVILFLSQDITLTHLAKTSSLLEDMTVAYSALEEVDQASATKLFHDLLAWAKILRQEIVNENARLGEEMQTLKTHWEEYAAEAETEREVKRDDGVKERSDSEGQSEKECVFGASNSQPDIAVLLDRTHLIIEALREPNSEHDEPAIVKDDDSSIAEILATLASAVKGLNNKDAEMKTDHSGDIKREPTTGPEIYNSRPASKMGFKMLSEEFRKKKAIPSSSVPTIGTSKDTFPSASSREAHGANIGEVDYFKIAEAEVLRETFKACKTEQEHWDAIGDAFAKMKGTSRVGENVIPFPSRMPEAEPLRNVFENCKTEQLHRDAVSDAFSNAFANFKGDLISQTVREAFKVEVADTKPNLIPIPERKKKAHRGKRGGVKHHKRTQPSPQDMSNTTHSSFSSVEHGSAAKIGEQESGAEPDTNILALKDSVFLLRGHRTRRGFRVEPLRVNRNTPPGITITKPVATMEEEALETLQIPAEIDKMRPRPAVEKRIEFPLGREKLTTLKRVGLESEEVVRQVLLQNGNGKEKERPSPLRPTLTPHLAATPPVPVDQAISISALKKLGGRLSENPKFLATDSATLTLVSASTLKTTAHQRQTRAQTQETSAQDRQKILPRVLEEEDELKNIIEPTKEVMHKMAIQMPAVEPSSSKAEVIENTVLSENLSKDQDMRKGKQETAILHTKNSEHQDIEPETEREGVAEEWIEYAEDDEYQEIYLENEVESGREGEDDFVYLETDAEQSDERERI